MKNYIKVVKYNQNFCIIQVDTQNQYSYCADYKTQNRVSKFHIMRNQLSF